MDIKKALEKIDEMNEGYWDDEDDYDDDGFNRNRFRQPGSALHPGTKDDPIDQPCPTCGEENVLTRRDVAKGYQCDTCADRAEGRIQYESKKPSLKDYFRKIDEAAISTTPMPIPVVGKEGGQTGSQVGFINITDKSPAGLAMQQALGQLAKEKKAQIVVPTTKPATTTQSNQPGTTQKPSGTTQQTTGTPTQVSESDDEPVINGKVVDLGSLMISDVDTIDYPDFADAFISKGTFADGTPMSDEDLEEFQKKYSYLVTQLALDSLYEGKAKNKYAIGMATAMKQADDEPPLKKSTIVKAHEIAKAIKEGQIDEISKAKLIKHIKAADARAMELGRQGMEKYRAGDKEGGAEALGKSGKYYKMSSPHAGLAHKKLAGVGVKVPATGEEPGEVKYVITKVGRTPGKVSGLAGQKVKGITIKDVYTDKAEAQKHADHLSQFNPVGYEVVRIFDEGVEDQKLGTLAREIEMQVAAHFPDSEGLDAIMSRARKIYGFDRNYPEYMLMDLINDAVKKHLGSNDFYSYVEDFHAQHASDNPEDEDMYEQGVAEGKLNEKWGTETKVAPSEKGKYKGKTKAELLKHYNKLKKSGPHKKGSKEYGTMRELSFAIRAKSGWGKVKEAERPSDQVDMGAGLGAGRSQTVLESNMKKTCQAAYHEGKSHGLGGHAYTCRYDEGTDEHMHYHKGFKEGLDECYGIQPMRGVVDEGIDPIKVGDKVTISTPDSRFISKDWLGKVGKVINLRGNQAVVQILDSGVNVHADVQRLTKVVDETMAATVPGMASQAIDECGMMSEGADSYEVFDVVSSHMGGDIFKYEDAVEAAADELGMSPAKVDRLYREHDSTMLPSVHSSSFDDEDDIDEGVIGGLAGGAIGARLGGVRGAMTGYKLGSAAQDMLQNEDMIDEMNKTEYMKHMAKKTPGKTFKAFGQTFSDDEVLESDYTFESLDRQLNALLNESEQVTEGSAAKKVIIKGLKNWIKAAKEQGYSVEGPFNPGGLYQAYSQSGSHRGTFSSEDEPGPGSLWGNSKPGMSANSGTLFVKNLSESEHVTEGISVSISKGQQGGHDSVSVTATDAEADNLLALVKNAGMGIFADEQKTSDYGAPVSHEGHAEVEDHGSVLDLMKKMAGIESKSDYEQESDEGCGCGQSPCGCDQLDEVESEDQMEFEVAEDATEVAMTDADEESEAKTDQALAVSDQQDDEKLDEWANDAMQKGTEEAFTTGDEFMLDTISGGLDKKKSTGQATIPVNAAQKDRLGYNESIRDWKKLAGI